MVRKRSKTTTKTKRAKKKPARARKAPSELKGRRYLRLIEEQLEGLHEQPAHGNRELFMDQLVVGHLLAFYNPAVTGLRSIEDIFEDERVQ